MDIDWLLDQHEDKFVKRDDGCWVWTGARAGGNETGESEGRYGYVGVGGEMRYVHRIAAGDVPDGAFVLHSCDNPPCFNPEHLHIGTQRDNQKEALLRGRKEPNLEVLAEAREGTGYDQTGADHPASKLSEDDRREIRERYHSDDGPYQRELADEYGVSSPTISRIVRGKDYAE